MCKDIYASNASVTQNAANEISGASTQQKRQQGSCSERQSGTEITIIGQVDATPLPAPTDIEKSRVGVAYLSASLVTLPNYCTLP